MVVDILDKHDPRRPPLLCFQGFADGASVFRSHDASKRAVCVEFAWLVVENEHDLAGDVHMRVVLMLQVVGRDAEAGSRK